MRADTIAGTFTRLALRADPLADETMAAILGAWQPAATMGARLNESDPTSETYWHTQSKKLALVTSIFSSWVDNQSLNQWRASADTPPEIEAALTHFLHAANQLPAWADHSKIARAENLFADYGVLPVALLFCASLPQCYVLPDLSAVLHTTGELTNNADHRIRATGAMIFPVMMRGGLTQSSGGGIAQILKVRLIHATIRHLILRGDPGLVTTADAPLGKRAALSSNAAAPDRWQALFARGWDVSEDGIPCDQEELAYTLLTFSYVFLCGMRTLGIALSQDDEEAYLHTWNVVGHTLGIERALMADTMVDAQSLFAAMQARGRADRLQHPHKADPRPALGNALMGAMETVIPLPSLKSFPVLLTRLLCGSETARDLGIDGRVSWLSRTLFALLRVMVRSVDWLVRLISPDFAISRFLTRLLGYQLISKLLMDQTRPLRLPENLQLSVTKTIRAWGHDAHASAWVNRLEDYFTTVGDWHMQRTPSSSTPAQKEEGA